DHPHPPDPPPPGLPAWVHRHLPRPSLRATPRALRYGRGSLLCTTRISPILRSQRGRDWTRKGGHVWTRIDRIDWIAVPGGSRRCRAPGRSLRPVASATTLGDRRDRRLCCTRTNRYAPGCGRAELGRVETCGDLRKRRATTKSRTRRWREPAARHGSDSRASSSSKSRALVGVHVLSLAFMRSGGMEKVARDCRKTCQEGKRT